MVFGVGFVVYRKKLPVRDRSSYGESLPSVQGGPTTGMASGPCALSLPEEGLLLQLQMGKRVGRRSEHPGGGGAHCEEPNNRDPEDKVVSLHTLT